MSIRNLEKVLPKTIVQEILPQHYDNFDDDDIQYIFDSIETNENHNLEKEYSGGYSNSLVDSFAIVASALTIVLTCIQIYKELPNEKRKKKNSESDASNFRELIIEHLKIQKMENISDETLVSLVAHTLKKLNTND